MNNEGGIAPMPAPVEAPVATMERPTMTAPAPEATLLTEEDNQAITLLESGPRDSSNAIETTLTQYVDSGEDIIEGEFTVEPSTEAAAPAAETPVIELQEPAAPTPPEGAKQTFDYDAAQKQIDSEIDRQSGNDPARRAEVSTKAYDQLVYQYPDRAQALADRGNKDAAAALARRDELAKNPSSSTAMETRAKPETQTTEIVRTETTVLLRDAQARLVEVQEAIERAGDKVPEEIKRSVVGLSEVTAILILLLINSLQTDTEAKVAVGTSMNEMLNKKKKVRTETRVISNPTVTGGEARPQLEDKKAEEIPVETAPPQLEAAPQRMLMLPAPEDPATVLPEAMQQQALMLPEPAPDFNGPTLDLNAAPAPVPAAAPTS